jgi:hypothetical protein
VYKFLSAAASCFIIFTVVFISVLVVIVSGWVFVILILVWVSVSVIIVLVSCGPLSASSSSSSLLVFYAKAQISDRVCDILRTFCIKDWQSEPYKGNQNFAEQGWKDTKTWFNHVMNTTGANPKTWLLALAYTCKIQNHLAIESLDWRTPTNGYTDTHLI